MKDLAQIRAGAAERIRWEDLDQDWILTGLRRAKEEDTSAGGLQRKVPFRYDVTSRLLDPEVSGEAFLVARKPGILCGLPLVELILRDYDSRIDCEALVEEGSTFDPGKRLARIQGPAASILTAERVALNHLQKLTGIATWTRRHVDALGSNWTRLLDTRKTTPGLRVIEKWAVATGGGWNHRIGLFDRVMLKDNHLAATGSSGGDRLTRAVQNAVDSYPDLLIEVEVDNLAQIEPAADAGADIFLLDNFSLHQLKEAVRILDGVALTEASGGVELETLPALGEIGLDFVSSGALTHQAVWLDIGLDWK